MLVWSIAVQLLVLGAGLSAETLTFGSMQSAQCSILVLVIIIGSHLSMPTEYSVTTDHVVGIST